MRILRSAFLLLLSFCVVHPAMAQNPRDFINGVGEQVIDVIRDPSTGDDEKESRLEDLFEQTVDVKWIGQFVLGRHWRSASEAQKDEYLRYYRTFLIHSYTAKFRDYTGETFKILDSRDDSNGKYLLTMELVRPKDANVIIDYKVRTSEDGSYKIYDIIVEGVSLITTQRSEFNSVVSRKGLDFLIKQLRDRKMA